MLSENQNESLKGSLLHEIDLKDKEAHLEKNLWIRNADMYFDHHDRLQVIIEQRIPVARIFCKDQSTFYLDDQGIRLPFSFQQIASVPVFTSFPESSVKLNTADSLLLMQIRDMGLFFLKQPVWKAQIEQIDLIGSEMVFIPKIGRHEILFGKGTMIEQKFKRLQLFYQQIVNKTGWNYYSRLDLRFNKLLIGVRRDSASIFQSFFISADSLQKFGAATESFVDSSDLINNDSLGILQNNGAIPKDTLVSRAQNKKENRATVQSIKKDTGIIKKSTQKNASSPQKNNSKDQRPKAVMLPGNSKDSTIKKQ
jgi:cell division protein FtsQ